VTKPWDNEVMDLFRQHLRFLRAGREDTLAQIAASQEMIERSRALILQIDEHIDRVERELRLVGGGGGGVRNGLAVANDRRRPRGSKVPVVAQPRTASQIGQVWHVENARGPSELYRAVLSRRTAEVTSRSNGPREGHRRPAGATQVIVAQGC
jgi:hypothetical protein